MVAGKLEETTQTDSLPIQIKTSIEACMYLSPANLKLHQSACMQPGGLIALPDGKTVMTCIVRTAYKLT